MTFNTKTKRQYFFMILMLAGMCIVPMSSMDMFLPSLNSIGQSFHASHDTLQYTITAYVFMIGLGQLIFGPLIDRFGQRKVAMYSIFVYILASAFAMLSIDIMMLIGARALQAAGASSLFTIAFSCTRDIEDDVMRTKAMSYVSMTTSVSPMVSPLIGAFIESHLHWRFNFAVMMLLGLCIGVAIYYRLQERAHFGKEIDTTSLMAKYYQVISSRYYWHYALCLIFAFIPLMSFLVIGPYLLMNVLGLSSIVFAILFGLNSTVLFFGNLLGIKLRKAFTVTVALSFGAALICIGGAGCAVAMLTHHLSVYTFMISNFIFSLGTMVVLPISGATLLNPFPKLAATATGLAMSLRMLISAIITAIAGTWVVAHILIYPMIAIVSGVLVWVFAFSGRKVSPSR